MKLQLTEKDIYIILEPYVFLKLYKNEVILYNTYNGSYIESDNPCIFNIFRKEENVMHLYKLDANLICEDVLDFITLIEKNQFGALHRINKKEPVQFFPLVNIQADRKVTPDEFNISDKALVNLTEITVHLNSLPDTEDTFYASAFKQLICPLLTKGNSVLNFNNFLKFIEPCIQSNTLNVINFVGSNIDNYNYFKEFIQFLQSKRIYSRLFLLVDEASKISKNWREIDINLNFIIKRLKNKENLDTNIPDDVLLEKYNYQCIVESEDDYWYFEKFFKQKNMVNYTILPYYNGDNCQFFNDNVFIEKEDIFGAKHEFHEIHSNSRMNPLNFGKFTILNNGDVYANVNKSKIGEIETSNIYNLVFDEIKNGESWFDSRSKNFPCKNCLYNFLCPPISNYEYNIGKCNLCKIHKN